MSILPAPQLPSPATRLKQGEVSPSPAPVDWSAVPRSRNPADRLLWVYGRLQKLELRPFLPSCLKPCLWGGLRRSQPNRDWGKGCSGGVTRAS